MIDKSKIFCPLMSMRIILPPTKIQIEEAKVAQVDVEKLYPPMPSDARCRPECGFYDHGNECCSVLSINMNLIKLEEGVS